VIHAADGPRQSQLEVQIYNAEGAYLTETYTQGTGNIITGFDNYLKNQTTTRRRNEVTDGDRLFSNSSTTYLKARTLSLPPLQRSRI
jgi:chromatin modification-related protein EAF6